MYCLMLYKRSPTGWCHPELDDMGDEKLGEPMDAMLYVLPKQDDGGRTSDPCSRSRVYQA
jgi:hypothetical protein